VWWEQVIPVQRLNGKVGVPEGLSHYRYKAAQDGHSHRHYCAIRDIPQYEHQLSYSGNGYNERDKKQVAMTQQVIYARGVLFVDTVKIWQQEGSQRGKEDPYNPHNNMLPWPSKLSHLRDGIAITG